MSAQKDEMQRRTGNMQTLCRFQDCLFLCGWQARPRQEATRHHDGEVGDYEKLLKDLVNRVGDPDSKLIRTFLDKETIYNADDPLFDSMAEAKAVPTLDL